MRSIYTTVLIVLFAQLTMIGQNGIIKGEITNKLTNEPIMFANLFVVQLGTGTSSDLDGTFEFSGLKPGSYDINVSYLGYEDVMISEIEVSNAKPAIVYVEMNESKTDLEEVVVKASPFTKVEESPVSLRSLGVAEIKRNPGGNSDISKVVQSLPGVTSVSSFRNDLIIRGGAPNENRFYLDDVEVPNINHFATQGASGGPVGMINVDFVREVDFYSGAFPANRGNTLSSVFNFKFRDGRDDKLGFKGTIGASDFGITLEGPVGEKTTFLASARRSYLDLLFKAIGLPFSPTYNDFQLKIKTKLDQQNELTFIGLGAIDQFQLNLDQNETEEKQFLLNSLPISPQWNYTNGLVYKRYNDNGYWTFVVSRNMLNNRSFKYAGNDDSSEENLILDYKSQEIENKFRAERTQRMGVFKLNAGLNYELSNYNNSTFQKIFTSQGARTIDYSTQFNFQKYGAFAQLSGKFIDERLSLSFGLRTDANSYSDEMSNPVDQISPRISASYALTPSLSINANGGIYYQLPAYTLMGYSVDDQLINKDSGLSYLKNRQLVFGLEYQTSYASKLSVEGYIKEYSNYPFLLRDSINLANLGSDFGVIGNEEAVSIGEGLNYGIEILFQQRLFKGFYGIASYTLGWSQFADKNGTFIPSSWDSRHIVNIALGKKLNNDWEIGLNWRFQTALPYTPFDENSSLVSNWNINGRGIPDYERLNSLRSEASNTLDLRIDKKWYFNRFNANLYLDIENVWAASVPTNNLVLDRPLDENNTPIGEGIIINPNDPIESQRYQTKLLNSSTGFPLPTLGVIIEF